jgi:hypothetical protein
LNAVPFVRCVGRRRGLRLFGRLLAEDEYYFLTFNFDARNIITGSVDGLERPRYISL